MSFVRKSTNSLILKQENMSGDLDIEQLMNSRTTKDINAISINYASGQFENIKSTLNQTTYNDLAVRLYKSRKVTNPNYEKVRKILSTNLEGLLQSVNLYNTNTDLTHERNMYKLKADKLNDANALIEQLNMLRNAISLFPEQTITVIPVQIKPEYLAYIKTYGYPENGIWDPDLLGSIIMNTRPITI